MGAFANSVLSRQEEIIREAKISNLIFLRPCFLFMIAIILMASGGMGNVFGVLLIIVSFLGLIRSFVIKTTTELVLTNKRVVSKFGFLRRSTMDTNLIKIEGVNFSQSVFGRLFGYGTVIIRGTGGDPQSIPFIADPVIFKKSVNEAIDGPLQLVRQ